MESSHQAMALTTEYHQTQGSLRRGLPESQIDVALVLVSMQMLARDYTKELQHPMRGNLIDSLQELQATDLVLTIEVIDKEQHRTEVDLEIQAEIEFQRSIIIQDRLRGFLKKEK